MRSLNELISDLTAPFPSDQIELKPGALTQSRDRALAMAYADSRVYQDRLDAVVGPADWQIQFQATPDGVICTLTILGVSKADVGDFPVDYADKTNENHATTAAAQAFKRACAQFGLGRYLYALPRTWADYDSDQRVFRDPQGIVHTLYHAAGLAAFITADARHPDNAPTSDSPPPTRSGLSPDPQRLATARAALATTARTTAPASGSTEHASDAQLGLIARLIIGLLQHTDETDVASVIDTVGEAFAIATLSQYTRKDRLRTLQLPKPTASLLIQRLKELEVPLATAA